MLALGIEVAGLVFEVIAASVGKTDRSRKIGRNGVAVRKVVRLEHQPRDELEIAGSDFPETVIGGIACARLPSSIGPLEIN